MAEKEPRLFWVWGQIEETTHAAMMEIATEMGKHYRVVVEQAVEEFIAEWVKQRDAKNKPVGKKARFESIILNDRLRQTQLSQLKQLAYNHMENQTDESAEQLAAACDLLGVPVETILSEVSNMQQLVEVDPGVMLNEVARWLLEIMLPGKRYPSQDILDIGKARGFTEYKIRAAKTKLGVESRREGYSWVWVLPARDEEEEQ